MWHCKECDGNIKAIETRNISRTYTLDKNGDLKKCTQKTIGDTEGINYFCEKCDCTHDVGIKLKDIANWEEN